MTPVGETLRRERMKRNLDLEEISRELKISTRFLQAIENDQYDKLPGGVFVLSFVRQYARLLGLDEEAIAGQVQQTLSPLPEISLLAEKPRPSGVSPIHVPKVDEWETVGDRRFRWSGWLSAVLLVAVMLVCSAVYAWMQRPKLQATAQPAPVQTTPAPALPASAPVIPPSAAPVPGQSVPDPSTGTPATAASPQPVDPRPADSRPAEQTPEAQRPPDQRASETKPVEPNPEVGKVSPSNPDAPIRVTITADEPVWLLARADGKYAFSATMDAHTTRTVEGIKEITVRLGNAGGVTISLNGKSIGPAGPKGQVRTLQFTSGGFQIVPAKSPSGFLDRL